MNQYILAGMTLHINKMAQTQLAMAFSMPQIMEEKETYFVLKMQMRYVITPVEVNPQEVVKVKPKYVEAALPPLNLRNNGATLPNAAPMQVSQ